MAGASHREIALQKLASGQITDSQFDMLQRKFFPPAAPPAPPSPVPVQPWDLPLINPVPRPGVEPPKPADPFAVDPSTVTSEQLNAMFNALKTK